MICLIEALRRSSVFASVIIQGACEPRVFNLQPANTLRMTGFAKHVCRRGCFIMIFSSCFFAFADASAAGDASVSSDPSIQSVFESTVVKLNAKPDDKTIPVEWTYTNHFEGPLMVERFDQSCGCLSGQVAPSGHETVPPGKTAKIRATFTPGNHRGVLSKSLHVRFVGHEHPVELIVEVTIASHVEFSQRELVWKAGEKPEAKTIEIKSGTGKPFSITGLLGIPEDQFAMATETLEEKKHYRLSITPKSEATGQHCLQVRTDSPDPRDSVQAVFLRVDKTPLPASGL